jgi:hypothetical protein
MNATLRTSQQKMIEVGLEVDLVLRPRVECGSMPFLDISQKSGGET